ncbi:hypothetical protein [Amycolatopsis sp. WGS_07]|uniref:hypothetical protein n=1 Tax=Amycolatopsis sp. WGS_07 TaxID=3076764 RepID=UPI00387357F5
MSKHATEIFGFELHRRLAEVRRSSYIPAERSTRSGPARPVVAAVASPDLRGDEYLGPHRTAVAEVQQPVTTSRDPELGAWLWTETERLLGGRIPTEPRHPIG